VGQSEKFFLPFFAPPPAPTWLCAGINPPRNIEKNARCPTLSASIETGFRTDQKYDDQHDH
jgi:hypothetical protein